MSVSSLAASPAPLDPAPPAASRVPPANDAAPAAGPAAQVSLSAEARLTLAVFQQTRITVSVGSGPQDGAAPTDPRAAKALSTLQRVGQPARLDQGAGGQA